MLFSASDTSDNNLPSSHSSEVQTKSLVSSKTSGDQNLIESDISADPMNSKRLKNQEYLRRLSINVPGESILENNSQFIVCDINKILWSIYRELYNRQILSWMTGCMTRAIGG